MDLPTHADFFSNHLTSCMEVDDSGESCPICIEDYTDPVTTRCEHNFCRECLQTWCKDQNTCPFCRTELFTAATIPSRRLVQIPEDFYEQLNFSVFYREAVRNELEAHHNNMRYLIDGHLPALDGLLPIHVDHHHAQSILVGAVIWYWNKVDDDFAPHLRDTFKRDWIKLMHALNNELSRHQGWEGRVGDWKWMLLAKMMPSQQEPRRFPGHERSWKSQEDSAVWFREHADHWESDGWVTHVRRMFKLVDYLVLSQLVHTLDEDSEDESTLGDDSEDEGPEGDS